MSGNKQHRMRRAELRHRLLHVEAQLRDLRHRRTAGRPQRTADRPPVEPVIDAHDHAAMLVRWQHWLGWLEAQRLEVEQRIAARGVDDEEVAV